MSLQLKNVAAGTVNTERGRPSAMSVDTKTKNKLVYGCGNNVIIRDIKNPLNCEIYMDHTSKVTSARFSHSGFYCCSGDESGTVRVWATDNADKTLKIEIKPISKAVRDIAWTPDNQRIVAVGEGKGVFAHVFLWDSGSPVGSISGHSQAILSTDVRPQRPFRIATGSEDNCTNFYQGPPFKFLHSFKEHTRYVNCVRFSPNGEKYVSVGSDKTGFLFDGKTGEKLGQLEKENGHTASIYGVSWSPDSKQFATCGADKSVKIWDESTRKVVKTYKFQNSIEFMQVSIVWVDQDLIISLGMNGDLTYIDPSKDEPIKVVCGHNDKIFQVILDPTTSNLYTAGSDGALLRWDSSLNSLGRAAGKGHDKSISNIAIAGDKLVSCSIDQSVRFTPLSTFTYTGESITLQSAPTDVAVSKADSNLVVITTYKNITILYDEKIKAEIETKFKPTCVAISPDGNEIVIGGADKKTRIYSLDSTSYELKEVAVLDNNKGQITKVTFSNDGKMLAVGDTNREVIVFDTSSRTAKYTDLVYHTSSITGIEFDKTSTYLVSSSVDRSIIVWDLENGKRIITEGAHRLGVTGVCITGDNTIASVGNDFCVKSWEYKF